MKQKIIEIIGHGMEPERAELKADELIILFNTSREMYLNMQFYMEYCESNGYVTPQDWLEKHKHF